MSSGESAAGLRVATVDDFEGMHRVRLAVRENRLVSAVLTREDYEDALTPPGRGWVIESAGRIVGFATIDGATGHVWALFVDPAHEGRGYGRRLLDTAVAWARAQGASRCDLTTEPDTRAARFYAAAGWVVVGRTESGDLCLVL